MATTRRAFHGGVEGEPRVSTSCRPARCARSSTAAALSIVAATTSSTALGAWTFTDLHPPSATSASVANSVEGTEQVGWAGMGTWRGGTWNGSANTFTDFTPTGAGANASFLWGTSSGQQAGRVSFDSGFTWQAAVWTGSAASYVNMHPGGWAESRANAVHNGAQAGWVQNGTTFHAAAWSGTAGSFIDLNPAGASGSTAWAVHGNQQGGVADTNAGFERAALWSGSAASYLDITPGAATSGWVRGMAAGQQVGHAVIGGNQHAALWSGTAASFIDLNPAGAATSYAWGVFGGFQVGTANFAGIDHAVLWAGSAGSVVDLHNFIPGSYNAIASNARGVWTDGFGNITVVGEYFDGTFISRAAMWQFTIPAPGAATLTLIGILASGRRQRGSALP